VNDTGSWEPLVLYIYIYIYCCTYSCLNMHEIFAAGC
jgi:hypothetical protein